MYSHMCMNIKYIYIIYDKLVLREYLSFPAFLRKLANPHYCYFPLLLIIIMLLTKTYSCMSVDNKDMWHTIVLQLHTYVCTHAYTYAYNIYLSYHKEPNYKFKYTGTFCCFHKFHKFQM